MVEKKFWNEKYAKGEISGQGSIGIYRNWKWNKIRKVVGLDINSLIDVGCGDLRFWNHPAAKRVLKKRIFKYIGIDISSEIIERNAKKYPNLKFVCSPAHLEINRVRSEIVFVLDLLFHIMDKGEFELIIENCCRYTNNFLVIYSWCRNPFGLGLVSDGVSQYYRNLEDYRHIFNRNDLALIREYKVPYDPYGKMYFYKRDLY